MKKVNFKKLRNQQKEEINRRQEYALLEYGNKISNKIEQLENKTINEREKQFSINTLELKEFTELLNTEGQHKRTTLDEIIVEYRDIPSDSIFNFLSSKQYLLNRKSEKKFFTVYQKPYSDIYIIPEYNAIENLVHINAKVVLSDKVVQEIKEYCTHIREDMKKNGRILIDIQTSNLKKKIDEEVQDRCKYALSIMDNELHNKLEQANKLSSIERGKLSFIDTLNLKKLSELVNPQQQQKMMSLDELWEYNSDISNGLIMDELVSKKYLCKIDFESNGRYYSEMITIRPFSDVMIIPVYDNMENRIIFEQQIVISDEVVKEINKYCSKVRNKTLNK